MSKGFWKRDFGWHWVALIALLLTAAALRFHEIGTSSYWLDELFALELSAGEGFRHEMLPVNALPTDRGWDCTRIEGFHPLSIWRNQVNDSHPPLHFIVLAAWRLLFGSGEIATRSLSLLFSLLTLLLVYLCVRSQSSPRPALWTVAILAVSGTQIQYAQETRNYTMASALLYATAWLILKAQKTNRLSAGSTAAIGALLWAGFLTHYLFLPAAAGLMLYGLLVLRDRSRWMLLSAGLGAAIVVGLTWLPFLLQQQSNGLAGKITWMGVLPGSAAMQTLVLIQRFAWDNLLIDSQTPPTVRSILSLLLLFPLIGIARFPQLRIWMAIALAGLVAVIATDLRDGTDRLAVTRYTLLLTPALWASVVLFADTSRLWRHALPALVVGLCLFRLGEVYVDRKADWRGIAQWFSENTSAQDVIVFSAPRGSPWIGGAMQAGIGHYAGWIDAPGTPLSAPRATILDRRPTPGLLAAILETPGRALVISPGAHPPPVEIGHPMVLESVFEPTLAVYRLVEEAPAAASDRGTEMASRAATVGR